MALSIDDPNSRARREDAPSSYLAYLNSPAWRRTRNAALQRARYTCHRCGSRRDLNVHHTTYQRLGAERHDDLEVLCFTCHNGHHKAEAQTTELGIYLKVVSVVLDRNPFAQIADIADETKTLCAQRKIPVKAHLIDKAIAMACATRLKDQDRPYRSVVERETPSAPGDPAPITHAQAVELLARLGFEPDSKARAVKPMPRARMVTRHEADKVKAFEMVTQEIMASIARCEALEAEETA